MKDLALKIADQVEAALKEMDSRYLLREVIEELEKRDHLAGQAVITSAIELSPEEKELIEAKLNVHKVNYLVDSSILGGMVIEKEGLRQDLSLRRRLNEIKKIILE